MAISVFEKYGSRGGTLGESGEGESFALEYVVLGTTDHAAVMREVMGVSPPQLLGYTRQLARQPAKIQEKGSGVWYATVDYKNDDSGGGGNQSPPEPLAYTVKFDGAGISTKAIRSIKLADNGRAHSGPDNTTAVGWDGKKVNGVNIYTPSLKITLEVPYPPAYFRDNSQVAFWARQVGRMNNDQFLGFNPNELLFTGFSGSVSRDTRTGQSDKLVPVSFTFEASENITEQQDINNQGLIVSHKAGWDYLDVRYSEQPIEGDGVTITVPVAQSYKVHRMYYETSFRQLTNIG